MVRTCCAVRAFGGERDIFRLDTRLFAGLDPQVLNTTAAIPKLELLHFDSRL